MTALPPHIAAYVERLRAFLAPDDPVEELLVDLAAWAASRVKFLLDDPRSLDPFGEPEWSRAHSTAMRDYYRAQNSLTRHRRPAPSPRPSPPDLPSPSDPTPPRPRSRRSPALPSLDAASPAAPLGPQATSSPIDHPEIPPPPPTTVPESAPVAAGHPSPAPSSPRPIPSPSNRSRRRPTHPPSTRPGHSPSPAPSTKPDLLSTPLDIPRAFRQALLAPRTRPPDNASHPFTASLPPRASPSS